MSVFNIWGALRLVDPRPAFKNFAEFKRRYAPNERKIGSPAVLAAPYGGGDMLAEAGDPYAIFANIDTTFPAAVQKAWEGELPTHRAEYRMYPADEMPPRAKRVPPEDL